MRLSLIVFMLMLVFAILFFGEMVLGAEMGKSISDQETSLRDQTGEVSRNPKEEEIFTNTDPVMYQNTESVFEDMKKNFPDFSSIKLILSDGMKNVDVEVLTYVIPGLRTTRTMDKTGKVAACHEMTPQGMTVTEDYILITAYCHNKKHDSVIYVLDINTGEYVKTVILPGCSHVGGIAYDKLNGLIWISETIHQKAAVGGIKLQDIIAYEEGCDQSIAYAVTESFPDLSAISFLCYHDHVLYVGTFDIDSPMDLLSYLVNPNATIADIPFMKRKIDKQVQGVAVQRKKTLISKSYGPVNSILGFYLKDLVSVDNYNLTSNATFMNLELPQKLEQITLTEQTLYMLFESAATAYRDRDSNHIDRVIAFRRKDTIENKKGIFDRFR